MKIILTNDDGQDSPLLNLTLEALSQAPWCSKLNFVVPEEEKSWIAQAATRFKPLNAEQKTRKGIEGFIVDGTPADCSYLSIDNLFEQAPDLVISGINIGTNAGTAFYLSSGTIGAARAAALRGVPALAFSLDLPPEIFNLWHTGEIAAFKQHENKFREICSHAEKIVAALTQSELHKKADIFSINIPWEIKEKTNAIFTKLERVQLQQVFSKKPSGQYIHDFEGIEKREQSEHGDLSILEKGQVSITAVTYRNGISYSTESTQPGDKLELL